MKVTGVAQVKEHGRTYHVATCKTCGASVTLTDKQYKSFEEAMENELYFFDDSFVCCEAPNYFYGASQLV